jgi:hypothetical protein
MTWDGITDEEIIERDGWRCRMPSCSFRSRVIPRDARYGDPRYRTADHIVPLSLGGDDTAVNKRAAHSRCNTARSNRMDAEQLPLFGVLREAPTMVMAGTKPAQMRIEVCRECGAGFPATGTRAYCDSCREARKPRPQVVAECRWCSCPFSTPDRGRNTAKSCPACHKCSGCGKNVTVIATSLPPGRRLCHGCREARRLTKADQAA